MIDSNITIIDRLRYASKEAADEYSHELLGRSADLIEELQRTMADELDRRDNRISALEARIKKLLNKMLGDSTWRKCPVCNDVMFATDSEKALCQRIAELEVLLNRAVDWIHHDCPWGKEEIMQQLEFTEEKTDE